MQYDRETFEQQNYSVGRRFDALLQHRVSDHRKFLAHRNAFDTDGFRSELGRHGRDELRDAEICSYEEWED